MILFAIIRVTESLRLTDELKKLKIQKSSKHIIMLTVDTMKE
jgi:hypothetical protein